MSKIPKLDASLARLDRLSDELEALIHRRTHRLDALDNKAKARDTWKEIRDTLDSERSGT